MASAVTLARRAIRFCSCELRVPVSVAKVAAASIGLMTASSVMKS
jgi:hypothetical protein